MTIRHELLTLKEVAKLLRVSERSVYRYIDGGRLKATKVGYWRIQKKDFDAFLKQFSNRRGK